MATLAPDSAEQSRGNSRDATPRVLSRSASLIVSSRTRSEAVLAPRQPITFAIPTERLPVNAVASTSANKSSILTKLGRSLSRTGTLVRRVSGSRPQRPRSTSPTAARVSEPVNPAAAVASPTQVQPSTSAQEPPAAAPNTANVRRSMRVLARSRSEGRRGPRVAKEEEKMDWLVQRQRTELKEGTVTLADSGSGFAGSYFWDSQLGVCWDGREQVRPDLIASEAVYSSNADFIPANRVVYASTLSTFPPRPPLRRLSTPPVPPSMSESERIAADYRAANGLPSPSIPVRPLLSIETTPQMSPRLRSAASPVASDASSVVSNSSDSAPSSHRFVMGGYSGRASEDSATSLESLEVPPLRYHSKESTAPGVSSPLAAGPMALPRITLVDHGRVPADRKV